MGAKYAHWVALSQDRPAEFADVARIIKNNRKFDEIGQLQYGDHGLDAAFETVRQAIRGNKRIALYADYDVDGTMSCVSWIWFLRAIGFTNFVHYIPDRIKEGYGLNLSAVAKLIDEENAQLIITMDTGITANQEAEYCRSRGVDFLCTDHHVVQPEKMPDCVILNPKFHPDEIYQELCGCGITFVLLRKLAAEFPITQQVWTDLLALVGMATICDVVPLNGVNHRLAKLGVQALWQSRRPVLKDLREACSLETDLDEKDIGFRLGPRINAVGRLDHADSVVKAFIENDTTHLVKFMGECNDRRKGIQRQIDEEVEAIIADQLDQPILMLGGSAWHQGVVGIAASRVAERYWKPTWLFQRLPDLCKGSARSVPGFDVTAAMASTGELFEKFGGHKAAGGYSFDPQNESKIRDALCEYADELKESQPEIWQSSVSYDCELPLDLAELPLAEELQDLKPFGHGFEEPKFRVRAKLKDIKFYNDKQTGKPRHSAVFVETSDQDYKVMFFNETISDLQPGEEISLLVNASKNEFRGVQSLALYGVDYAVER